MVHVVYYSTKSMISMSMSVTKYSVENYALPSLELSKVKYFSRYTDRCVKWNFMLSKK